jgi:cell volume regulation protein A
VAVVAVGYFSTDSAGGSGYLGAFLAGLIVGNMDRLGLGMHTDHERDMRSLVATVTDVVVILVFITLGANLPWSDIWDNLAAALVVVVVGLILLARPVTVMVCLGADRRGGWTREEMVFMGWTRETGVVAAALGGLMVARGIPHAELVVTTVAVAIVVTLAAQTTTKVWLGRRLGLDERE